MTALRDEIAGDGSYGSFVDGFVFGYGELTWVELLAAVAAGNRWRPGVVRAGAGRAVTGRGLVDVIPEFEGAERYGWGRLTLPAQLSRRCAYGRCAFCTGGM